MLSAIRHGTRSYTLPRCLYHNNFRTRPWISSAIHGKRTYASALETPVPVSAAIQKLILDNIKATGPMSIAHYMQMCLSFPDSGYYMKHSNTVFGPKGDFVTSPEISQVFGELVAIWLISKWTADGAVPSIRVIELGPGRGTLMADMLRTIGQLLPSGALKRVHLVETSPSMRSMQDSVLRPMLNDEHNKLAGCELEWHDSVDQIKPEPSQYTMLVAHEFFDALPINILQRQEDGWHEVMVDSAGPPDAVDDNTEASPLTSLPPLLRPALSPEPSPIATILASLSPEVTDLPVGSQVEVSPHSFQMIRKLSEILAGSPVGGAGLVIDYGKDGPSSDSFRAFKDHKQVDVFHRPGECDLTADVDFSWLRQAMVGLVHPTETLTQAEFLTAMGLAVRVRRLAEAAAAEGNDKEKQSRILDAARRLVDPRGMGEQYKFMAFHTSAPPQDKQGSKSTWPFGYGVGAK